MPSDLDMRGMSHCTSSTTRFRDRLRLWCRPWAPSTAPDAYREGAQPSDDGLLAFVRRFFGSERREGNSASVMALCMLRTEVD